MTDYSKTKIYKIESHLGDKIYVGSTAKEYLSQRFQQHKNCYKQWKEGKVGRVTSYDLFEEYGPENCQIVLIESYPCSSKDEKNAKESHYIRALDCVNKVIPDRTSKQRYSDNIEIILEEKKQYYKKNKEKISEKDKRFYQDNKAKILEKDKQYYEENKVKILERTKKYREENKEKIKDYYEVNKEKIKERRKQQYEANKEKILERRKELYGLKKDNK